MSTVTIHCPHCGRELNVPDDAGKIVCMFCAGPIDVTALLSPAVPETPEAPEAEAIDLEPLLPKDLFEPRLYYSNSFTSTKYPEEYERYLELFTPALKAFRQNALTDEQAPEQFAELLFRKFQDALRKPNGKREESLPLRMTITALTVPAILSSATEESEKAADRLLELWNSTYPKEHLGKATFEQIRGGFKHKMCYITTAVCGSLGKGDSCTELNEFRAFRDNWLAHTESGPEKITEYYLFAPMIVRAIDASGSAPEEYRQIWERWLSPLLQSLRCGREEECAAGYEKMVCTLEQKWLS